MLVTVREHHALGVGRVVVILQLGIDGQYRMMAPGLRCHAVGQHALADRFQRFAKLFGIEADMVQARPHHGEPGSQRVGLEQALEGRPVRHVPRTAGREQVLSLAVITMTLTDQALEQVTVHRRQAVGLQFRQHDGSATIRGKQQIDQQAAVGHGVLFHAAIALVIQAG